MNMDPRSTGRRAHRSGYVTAGDHEDAKRRYNSFHSSFKILITVAAVVLVYLGTNSALDSHKLLSNRDYENVDSILIDDIEDINEEELFSLLKNTWTSVPSNSITISQAEDFIQHVITVEYTDGTQDVIYLYYNPYKDSKNGYAVRTIAEEDGDKLVLSYSGYEKLMEYIGDILG